MAAGTGGNDKPGYRNNENFAHERVQDAAMPAPPSGSVRGKGEFFRAEAIDSPLPGGRPGGNRNGGETILCPEAQSFRAVACGNRTKCNRAIAAGDGAVSGHRILTEGPGVRVRTAGAAPHCGSPPSEQDHMKKMDAMENGTNLKLVAAVIEALRKETGSLLDAETRELFSRLSHGLRRCAEARAAE